MKQFTYSAESDEVLIGRTSELRRAATETTGSQRTYICFSAGGNSYAIDSSAILEVINLHGSGDEAETRDRGRGSVIDLERLSILPIPHAPQFLPGVLNIRGTLHTVVDISMLLFNTPTRRTEHSQILLVRHADRTICILTESIAETLIIPLEKVQASTEAVPHELQNILTSAVPFHGKFIGLIQCEHLFGHPKLVALTQHHISE